jgi:mRNA interferase RelE/StbE
MNLDISKRAYKTLSDLQTKQFRQVMLKILSLTQNPHPNDFIKLKGYEYYNRVDSGEFRIVYIVEKNSIKIELVGKRNDDEVYKKLQKL